ncbi:unnamed protein product [Ophioblennius macclurei]
MDKYRPKRPTTLDLFPQIPQAGTQDSINNNSLGKKDSWKDTHSSSPHITGDRTPPDVKPKAEDKVRRRPAPKPPTTANGRANAQTAAATTARGRDRPAAPPSSGTPRSQRRAAAAGGGGGGGRGRGAAAMKERSLAEARGKDATAERRGRLCDARDKERNGPQRSRDANGAKGRATAADGRSKGGGRGGGRGGGNKAATAPANQEVYLPAMVVPRTPVAPKTQEQGQNHDRTQENPNPALSRSSSEGGSNRMSLSSDTEGPPPGPLHPSLSHRTNPDISEEDGEGDPTPCPNAVDGPDDDCFNGGTQTEAEENGGVEGGGGTNAGGGAPPRTVPKSESAAGLSYDSVKYTLVVDEHAQLELVDLKDTLHAYGERNDDSDAETVYQSANEEEDPEYQEERRRSEAERKQERRREEEARKRREEDIRRRREEEVKRRKEVVATRVCVRSKAASATTSEDDESGGGRGGVPRSRKFLNLFANDSSPYSATGAGSFGMFSCVLDGVERSQSHRAAYRFVPRHADELHLETDDPVLMLNQSEDLWCHGYNMRTGSTGIFPAYYAVRVPREMSQVQKVGWTDQFQVRFLGSVQVPIHTGNDVLCAAMQKVACNRRSGGQPPPSSCVLEVSMKGVKLSVQDQCQSAHRGDQCYHFFQLKNISFCGCHPRHSRYFGFITKHPDLQRFACHVLVSETTLHPLAESVGRAFQQYYKEHIGYSCPTEDIFIE